MFKTIMESNFSQWVFGLFNRHPTPAGEGATLFIDVSIVSPILGWCGIITGEQRIMHPANGLTGLKHKFYNIAYGSTGVYLYNRHRKPRIYIRTEEQFAEHNDGEPTILASNALYDELLKVRPSYATKC